MLHLAVGHFQGLSVTVTGLSATVYNLSAKLSCLSVIKIPDCRTQMVKVTFPGQSGTFTDKLAEVTYCTVCFPTQSVCHHIQSGTPCLVQAGYLIETGLFH